MAKREFNLTQAQEKELLSAYNTCKDGPTKIRFQAIRLYGQKYAVEEIQHITNCSRTSLMEWARAYRQHGVWGLVDKRIGGNHAKLSRLQIEDLGVRLHQYTPRQALGDRVTTPSGQFWTIEALHLVIQNWYGVDYRSRASLQRLFRVCGFSYHRPERVYKSRRETQVMEFEEQLEKN
jgi:transposase